MLNLGIPGTGTLRAKRTFSGVCQVGFVFTGFFLILAAILISVYRSFQEQLYGTVFPHSLAWMWKWGAVCFGVSWLWTAITCVSLFRQAKAYERSMEANPPPRISDPPPADPGSSP